MNQGTSPAHSLTSAQSIEGADASTRFKGDCQADQTSHEQPRNALRKLRGLIYIYAEKLELLQSAKVSTANDVDAVAISKISGEAVTEGFVRQYEPKEMLKLISDPNYYVVVGKLDNQVVGYAISIYSVGKAPCSRCRRKEAKQEVRCGKGHCQAPRFARYTESSLRGLLRSKSEKHTSSQSLYCSRPEVQDLLQGDQGRRLRASPSTTAVWKSIARRLCPYFLGCSLVA